MSVVVTLHCTCGSSPREDTHTLAAPLLPRDGMSYVYSVTLPPPPSFACCLNVGSPEGDSHAMHITVAELDDDFSVAGTTVPQEMALRQPTPGHGNGELTAAAGHDGPEGVPAPMPDFSGGVAAELASCDAFESRWIGEADIGGAPCDPFDDSEDGDDAILQCEACLVAGNDADTLLAGDSGQWPEFDHLVALEKSVFDGDDVTTVALTQLA